MIEASVVLGDSEFDMPGLTYSFEQRLCTKALSTEIINL